MSQFDPTDLAEIKKFVYLRSMQRFALGALIVFLGGLCGSQSLAQQSAAAQEAHATTSSEQVKKRLNQILYWQLADELKLSPKIEKSMVVVIEDIQKKREEALLMRSSALAEIKTNPASKESLKKLHKALGQMATLDLEEYESLEKVLGTETLGRFYMVREKVAEKISHSIRDTSSR